MITPKQLLAITPHAPVSAVNDLNDIFTAVGADSWMRQAMIVAQLGHESNQFRATSEYNGAQQWYNPYFGRGWIQLTLKRNYQACGTYLGLDFVNNPDLVLEHNVEVCKWFWLTNNLNSFADNQDVDGCSRKINGGDNGLQQRRDLYQAAVAVLGFQDVQGGSSTQ